MLLICPVLNHIYFKVNLIKLLANNFIFKLLFGITVYSLNYWDLNFIATILTCTLICTLTYSIFVSKSRNKALFKLGFIYLFWTLLANDLFLLSNIGLTLNLTILLSFLMSLNMENMFGDISLYSEMDPSENIFVQLHNELQRLDLTHFNKSWKNMFGGGGSGPDIAILSTDEDQTEESLNELLKGVGSLSYVTQSQLETYIQNGDIARWISAIEYHNSNIGVPADVRGYPMDIYNNFQTYSDCKLSCIPDLIRMFGRSWENDLGVLKAYICSEVAMYNLAYGAKIYYEQSIPNYVIYKPFWDNWYLSQIDGCIDPSPPCNSYWNNMLIKSNCYNEAIDNQLVVGADILSLVYIYNKMSSYISVSKGNYSSFDVFQKLWEFRSEAIKLFAPFYDKHHEECVKYGLLHSSIEDIQYYIKEKVQRSITGYEDINRLNYIYGYKNIFLAERDSGVIHKDNFKPFKVFTPSTFKHHKYMNLDGVD